MSRPSLDINLMNGGLSITAPSEFGTSGVLMATPVAPVAGYGVPFLVKTISQAKTALAQAGNEDALSALVDGFFLEAPEGTKLYVMCMAQTTTLATMATAANADKVLNMANGNIRLLSFVKFPSESYEPTITNGFDQDVHNAVSAGQTLANAWYGKQKPFRFFIEGFGFVDAASAKDYSTASFPNGFLAPFNIDGSTATATLLVMGRAAASQPQRNIGRIKTGSLNISETSVVKIGSISADVYASADLDDLFDKRYITIEPNQTDSGYVFSSDCALTDPTDDYNNLRFGRISDNATRIIKVTYYNELKDDVQVDSGGRMATVVEKALADAIEDAIDSAMRSQLSVNNDGTAAVTCLVNPDADQYAALYEKNGIESPNFNLLSSGTTYVFVLYRPKGSLDYIHVYQGFTNQ